MTMCRAIAAVGIVWVCLITTGLTQQTGQTPETVRWLSDLDQARQVAAQTNRLVLVHFIMNGCQPCAKLEANVFPDPQFAKSLNAGFVAVKINVDEVPGIAQKYGVTRFPTDVVLTPAGAVVAKTGCPQAADVYIDQLGQIGDFHRKTLQQATQAPAAATAVNTVNNAVNKTVNNTVNNVANVAATPAVQAPVASTQVPGAASAWVQSTEAAANNTLQGVANQAVASPTVNAAVDRGYDRYAAAADRLGTTTAKANAAVDQTAVKVNQYAAGAEATMNRFVGKTQATADQVQQNVQNSANRVATGAANITGMAAAAVPQFATQPPVGQPPVGQPPAAQPQPPVAQSQPPAGQPALGLDGFDPVQLMVHQKWVAGDARWGAIHRGRVYLFVGSLEQQAFLANPDRYSPMLSGYDPVVWHRSGKLVSGKRDHGATYNDRMYLFSDEASFQEFQRNQDIYVGRVEQAMQWTDRIRR